jgi:aminobenzoyl-glutamate utilization protein B
LSKEQVFKWIDKNEGLLCDVAGKIWNNPELQFQEKFAAELQASVFKEAGFKVTLGLKNMPSALIAEYGSGKPIIGVLGEYDSLAMMSQKVTSKREPVKEGAPGHGCGHNLLGTGGVGAVLSIKKALESGEIKGTVRYYGCPAEETLAGKVFMTREGVFADLDACLSWHPASMNAVWGCSFLAMNSVKFKFSGLAAHAAAAPHLGRSALDAVELMDVGANYLREHINEKARIHYVITNGGAAPNIVPDTAEVWYFMRAPKRSIVDDIYDRLIKIAQGAALMTETKVDVELQAGCYDVLPNEVMGEVITKNMFAVGPPRYSDIDRAFAKELAGTFAPDQKKNIMVTYFAPKEVVEMTLHEGVVKNIDKGQIMAGSIDVGDVSWLVPFAQFTAATWPVGTAAHSWQAAASSGSGIGFQAMLFAARTLTGTLYDLFTDKTILSKAKEEFKEVTKGFEYKSPLTEGMEPKI